MNSIDDTLIEERCLRDSDRLIKNAAERLLPLIQLTGENYKSLAKAISDTVTEAFAAGLDVGRDIVAGKL